MLQKHCIRNVLFTWFCIVPHTSLKHYRKNIFINLFRNMNKMLYNMQYIHFFRNVIEKPQINRFKIFRKCFVLPGKVPSLTFLLPNSERLAFKQFWWDMPTPHAYYSGHMILSHLRLTCGLVSRPFFRLSGFWTLTMKIRLVTSILLFSKYLMSNFKMCKAQRNRIYTQTKVKQQ